MQSPTVYRRRTMSKPALYIQPSTSDGSAPSVTSGGRSDTDAKSSHGMPFIRYEAVVSPRSLHREPWWAFLVSYENLRITLLTFLYWGLSIATHQTATNFTYRRGQEVYKMRGMPPLPDIFHDNFPNMQPYRVIPEIGHVIPVLYLSGLMLYYFDQRSLDAFRTFLWAHGTLMFMRAFSFSSTLLPDASQQCHVSLFVGSCHDLIFSGHVMIMMLSVLMLQHFYWIPGTLRFFIGIDAVLTALLVITTHNHYTVDVLLSVFITPFVFIAFTRHPVLAGMGAKNPAKLLAKPSRLDASKRGGFCGCKRVSLRTGRDGYDRADVDEIQRITDHAHAALSLLGLKPRIMVYKPGQAVPLYADELCACGAPRRARYSPSAAALASAMAHGSGSAVGAGGYSDSDSAGPAAHAMPAAAATAAQRALVRRSNSWSPAVPPPHGAAVQLEREMQGEHDADPGAADPRDPSGATSLAAEHPAAAGGSGLKRVLDSPTGSMAERSHEESEGSEGTEGDRDSRSHSPGSATSASEQEAEQGAEAMAEADAEAEAQGSAGMGGDAHRVHLSYCPQCNAHHVQTMETTARGSGCAAPVAPPAITASPGRSSQKRQRAYTSPHDALAGSGGSSSSGGYLFTPSRGGGRWSAVPAHSTQAQAQAQGQQRWEMGESLGERMVNIPGIGPATVEFVSGARYRAGSSSSGGEPAWYAPSGSAAPASGSGSAGSRGGYPHSSHGGVRRPQTHSGPSSPAVARGAASGGSGGGAATVAAAGGSGSRYAAYAGPERGSRSPAPAPPPVSSSGRQRSGGYGSGAAAGGSGSSSGGAGYGSVHSSSHHSYGHAHVSSHRGRQSGGMHQAGGGGGEMVDEDAGRFDEIAWRGLVGEPVRTRRYRGDSEAGASGDVTDFEAFDSYGEDEDEEVDYEHNFKPPLARLFRSGVARLSNWQPVHRVRIWVHDTINRHTGAPPEGDTAAAAAVDGGAAEQGAEGGRQEPPPAPGFAAASSSAESRPHAE